MHSIQILLGERTKAALKEGYGKHRNVAIKAKDFYKT